MPSVLRTYEIQTYTSPLDLPDRVWATWRANACNANVMLPHAEQSKSRACADARSLDVWITCTSVFPTAPPTIDFILSCTSNHLGNYPIFIFTTLSLEEQASEDVIERLTSLATALLRSVPKKRVFSVFAPESIARVFSSIWTDITGVGLAVNEDPEYYAAKISYCTKSSFRPRSKSLLAGMQYELRQACEDDTLSVAQLCYNFAYESVSLCREGIVDRQTLILGHSLLLVFQ